MHTLGLIIALLTLFVVGWAILKGKYATFVLLLLSCLSLQSFLIRENFYQKR